MKSVVKIGGSLMKEGLSDELVDDLSSVVRGNRFVLVHGGGDVVSEWATKLGKEQRFVVSPEGVRSRYTDRETMEIYQMVMTGLVSKRLSLRLTKAGLKCISISGTDSSLLAGRRKTRLLIVDERGRTVAIDGGYTGKIQSVNTEFVDMLVDSGYLPIVSPVAISEEGDPLNVDGDRAASAIARAIGADSVIFVTNVDGLLLDGELVAHLTPTKARDLLPKIGFGMQKKVIAAAEAVEGGVREAIICSGRRKSPISGALNHDRCTVMSPQ
jgi:[amino group carrier protein]-L-2-aminoadipate 6-kinase